MKAAILEDLDWHEDALATIIGISHAQHVFTADDLARELRKPPHPNMVGQAFSAARTLGFIESVGFQISTNRTRKHGVLRTWTHASERNSA